PLSATEPIAALALRFEAELDLPLAAAEAGVTPEAFRKALTTSPALAQKVGPLLVDGGTGQRQGFVDAFPDMIRALNGGAMVQSSSMVAVRFIHQADALLEKGDASTAIQRYSEALERDPKSALAYNNRALAHKCNGDSDKALADLEQALQLDP